jgi:CheY-like chemotaxis protein
MKGSNDMTDGHGAASAAGVAPRRCVLVVDDDPDIRQVVRDALEEEGCIVAEAPDGASALEAARQEHPALILLDMKMPVMDGWAFAAAYQQEPAPRAPLVVVTAATDAAARAAEVGADGHLGKPFDLEDLCRVVGRFVADLRR